VSSGGGLLDEPGPAIFIRVLFLRPRDMTIAAPEALWVISITPIKALNITSVAFGAWHRGLPSCSRE
jgi:hypothetical protein